MRGGFLYISNGRRSDGKRAREDMTRISGITPRSDITGVPAVLVFLYLLCRQPGDAGDGAGQSPSKPLVARDDERGVNVLGNTYFFALPIAPLFLGFVEAGAFAAALGAGLVEGLGAVLAAGFPEDP
jgi:hypothetical protein